jgi:tRNA nucleotidyltransferase (CCA-adding enzyme)
VEGRSTTTSPNSLSQILTEVLDRVRPTPEDHKRMEEVSGAILSRIRHLAAERGLTLQAMLAGSAARGTWLAGDHDLDIFLALPEGSDLGLALEVARLVSPHYEERYAEHAYVHARIDGFDLDLVPCYLLHEATSLKSAVDRTPFHTRYVASKIGGLEDEVLLLKQFMKGAGVYGSELRTGGFSGYLAELLILHYRSFVSTLNGASSWRPGKIIDLEGHCVRPHQEPLVVVDPVDPKRNVAAALTLDKMLQFSAASRCFLRDPGLDHFFPQEIAPISDEMLHRQIWDRGSCFILLDFAAPPVVDDVLFPQLRKAEESATSLLEKNGFRLLRSDVGSGDGRAYMLFELEVWELPRVQSRLGPAAWEEEHLSRFVAAHPRALSGPYITKGRAAVEIPRRYTTARDLLERELQNLSLGKHLSASVGQGYCIYVGPELAEKRNPEFRIFLAGYLRARLRIC